MSKESIAKKKKNEWADIGLMLLIAAIGQLIFHACTRPVEYTRCDAAQTAARRALEGEGSPLFNEDVRDAFEKMTAPYCD